jgi:hypothetical protein
MRRSTLPFGLVRHRPYSPAWTDGFSHDPGIALLELLAVLGDALSWYQDQIANEARLRTRRRYAVLLAACAGLACWQKYGARRS